MSLISPSALAVDIAQPKTWLDNLLKQGVKKIHIDLVDPSFADYIGVDMNFVELIAKTDLEFDIHYMATWNEKLISYLLKLGTRRIFFHQERIGNMEFAKNINAGIAVRLGQTYILDVDEYIIMNVELGKCGQLFNELNLEIGKYFKSIGKRIISDGGITPQIARQLLFCDELVIGSAINYNKVKDFRC